MAFIEVYYNLDIIVSDDNCACFPLIAYMTCTLFRWFDEGMLRPPAFTMVGSFNASLILGVLSVRYWLCPFRGITVKYGHIKKL